MSFTRKLNPESSEALRRLKESLREFLAKTSNEVYHQYNTKLRIEEDILVLPRFDGRDSAIYGRQLGVPHRRDKPRRRDPRTRHEPIQDPCGKTSISRPDPLETRGLMVEEMK